MLNGYLVLEPSIYPHSSRCSISVLFAEHTTYHRLA